MDETGKTRAQSPSPRGFVDEKASRKDFEDLNRNYYSIQED